MWLDMTHFDAGSSNHRGFIYSLLVPFFVHRKVMAFYRVTNKSILLALTVLLVLENVGRTKAAAAFTGAQYLCGTDFIYAFNKCCGNQYPECINDLAGDVVHMQRRGMV